MYFQLCISPSTKWSHTRQRDWGSGDCTCPCRRELWKKVSPKWDSGMHEQLNLAKRDLSAFTISCYWVICSEDNMGKKRCSRTGTMALQKCTRQWFSQHSYTLQLLHHIWGMSSIFYWSHTPPEGATVWLDLLVLTEEAVTFLPVRSMISVCWQVHIAKCYLADN